jgi:hypothetical protein
MTHDRLGQTGQSRANLGRQQGLMKTPGQAQNQQGNSSSVRPGR